MLFDRFCFFLSLSTGAVTIGVINTLYGFLLTAYELLLVPPGYLHPKVFSRNELEVKAEKTVEVIYSENSLYTMQFLFGIYLIYGSVKERPSFLFANVILHIALAVYSACFVGFTILRILREEDIPERPHVINEILKIPVLSYFAFIIYGRHEEVALRSPNTMMRAVDRRQITDSDNEDFSLPA